MWGIKSEPFEGTPSANFLVKFKQFQGKAFLDQYQLLRGAGQITEVEGEKAQKALTDMDTAQTEKEFIKSARELQRILKIGWANKKAQIERMKKLNPIFEEALGNKAISAMDEQAITWANKNPTDPRAIKILQRFGLSK